MKTHGGRSFLKGHLFGDNIDANLAPCNYEGEGDMLGTVLIKSLVKSYWGKLIDLQYAVEETPLNWRNLL